MPFHRLVTQLHFTRHSLMQCLEGVNDDEARKRPLPMNCISWIVGHLASQENFYWVFLGQGIVIATGLNNRVGYGKPASTPPFDEMMALWKTITAAADDYLITLTPEMLLTYFLIDGKPSSESIGTMLMRNIYHYWFHIGEAHAIRQMLGHKNLPDFVGDMTDAVYVPEL